MSIGSGGEKVRDRVECWSTDHPCSFNCCRGVHTADAGRGATCSHSHERKVQRVLSTKNNLWRRCGKCNTESRASGWGDSTEDISLCGGGIHQITGLGVRGRDRMEAGGAPPPPARADLHQTSPALTDCANPPPAPHPLSHPSTMHPWLRGNMRDANTHPLAWSPGLLNIGAVRCGGHPRSLMHRDEQQRHKPCKVRNQHLALPTQECRLRVPLAAQEHKVHCMCTPAACITGQQQGTGHLRMA